jgi:hypothetical protein
MNFATSRMNLSLSEHAKFRSESRVDELEENDSGCFHLDASSSSVLDLQIAWEVDLDQSDQMDQRGL